MAHLTAFPKPCRDPQRHPRTYQRSTEDCKDPPQPNQDLPHDRPSTSQDSSKRSPSYPRPHVETIRTPQMPSATGSGKGHLEVEWALWQ